MSKKKYENGKVIVSERIINILILTELFGNAVLNSVPLPKRQGIQVISLVQC